MGFMKTYALVKETPPKDYSLSDKLEWVQERLDYFERLYDDCPSLELKMKMTYPLATVL